MGSKGYGRLLNRRVNAADYRKGMHRIVPKAPRLAVAIAAAAFSCAATIWAFLTFTPLGDQFLNYIDPPPPDCG
jgi:hypothetical protein